MDTRENDWHTPVPTHGLARQLTHAHSHIIHVLAVMVHTVVFSSGVSTHYCRPREIQSWVPPDL